MSSTEAAATAEPDHKDERIAFRGPMQRLLISPEIGAIVGATVVWALFWATGQKFGEASATMSWLDAAAPFGIMSVAVALLMIGGEFDLSSGVIVGSTGIFVGIFAQKFMGDGTQLWLAVLLAFLAAGCIGWINGWLVNRTGLPSFIVTLATFFVLRGVNLVFSKRLMNKVIVENINETRIKGFRAFKWWFAEKSNLKEFAFRDKLFLIMVIGGLVVLVAGVLEQSLQRRSDRPPAWAPLAAVVGLAGAVAGLVLAHTTDGTGVNTLAAVVGFGGAVLLAVGYAAMRYATRPATGAFALSGRPLTYTIVGVVSVLAAWLGTRSLDLADRRQLLSIPAHPVKVLLGLAAAVVTGGLAARWGVRRLHAQRAGGQKVGTMAVPKLVMSVLVAAGIGLVGIIVFLQIATVQGFRSIVLIGLGVFGIVIILLAKGLARRDSSRAQLLVALVAVAAILVYAFVLRGDAHAERFRSGLFTLLLLVAATVLANGLIEYHHIKRTAFDAPRDRLGRMLAGLGVALAVGGLVMRLLYSGQSVYRWIWWWIAITAIAGFVLARTKWGNWIFAVGGNKDAARAVGVPADQVKVGLFMVVSLLGCLVGMMTALRFNSVPAAAGVGKEFEYIIGAVVGGCLMTGGYGSVIGASVGAMIAPITLNGIPLSRWNSDNRFIFLGVVLLAAVLVNQKIRKKAQEAR